MAVSVSFSDGVHDHVAVMAEINGGKSLDTLKIFLLNFWLWAFYLPASDWFASFGSYKNRITTFQLS